MLLAAYGLTEAAPATHFYGTRDADSKIGSVGKLTSGMEARLVLEDGVTDAERGQQGELWVRGPLVMKVGGQITFKLESYNFISRAT